jgi:hypothetical protein
LILLALMSQLVATIGLAEVDGSAHVALPSVEVALSVAMHHPALPARNMGTSCTRARDAARVTYLACVVPAAHAAAPKMQSRRNAPPVAVRLTVSPFFGILAIAG